MKYLIYSLLFFVLTPLSAQIKGNGILKSRSQNVPNLKSIDVQFNANIVLDYNQEEVIKIQADENILEYIGVKFENGNLLLDQIKWINPSQQPTITIGSPNLKSVFQGTHSTTTIKNVKGAQLTLKGNVGRIIAEGQIDELLIKTGKAKVDVKKLSIGTVRIDKDCKSSIQLNKFENLDKVVSSEARIQYFDSSRKPKTNNNINTIAKVKYIQFKIKNNSIRRNSYYVKGPNGRGGNFSYGFSLFPYGTKSEKWSIGTNVFKESRSGKLTELVTIVAEDEGQVIDLH